MCQVLPPRNAAVIPAGNSHWSIMVTDAGCNVGLLLRFLKIGTSLRAGAPLFLPVPEVRNLVNRSLIARGNATHVKPSVFGCDNIFRWWTRVLRSIETLMSAVSKTTKEE